MTTLQLRDPVHRVSPKAKTMWRLGTLGEAAFTLLFLTVTVGFLPGVDLAWWMYTAVVSVFLLYGAVVPQWRYLVHRWEVTDTAVYTQAGWWARERRIAPMSRIQTVDYKEGAIARLFGLASVTVTTASAAGALSIDGLTRETAQRLVEELTTAADGAEGDAT